MKRIFKVFLLLVVLPILALFLAAFFTKDPGYVLITHSNFITGDFTYENTMLGFLFQIVLTFLAVYILIRLLAGIKNIPSSLMFFAIKRRQKLSAKLLAKAHMALLENKAEIAENLFLEAAQSNQAPNLCYIGAARAAQLRESPNSRDEYLSKINQENDPQNYLLACIYRAEIWCEAGDFDKAIKAVESLKIDQPHHPKVLELSATIYLGKSEFDLLYQLMPNLHRSISKYPMRDITAIELKYWNALLENAADTRDIEKLKDIWRHIDKNIRNNTELVLNYSTALVNLDYADDAAKVLQHALKTEWNELLITAFGHIYRGNTKDILKVAQDFAQAHPESDYAQLAVARLLIGMDAFTDALAYVEKAIQIKLTPDALDLFAKIKLHAGDEKAALTAYKKATEMLSQKSTLNPSMVTHLSVQNFSQQAQDFLPIDHTKINNDIEDKIIKNNQQSNLQNEPFTEAIVIHSDSHQNSTEKKD